jgi:hypothetical protein
MLHKSESVFRVVCLPETRSHAVMQGTLDLLILRALALGLEHGQGIARAIQSGSQGIRLPLRMARV